MKLTLKALGLGLGAAMLFVSPLAAMPQYCSNAKPGCGGGCHGDENLAKCPKSKGITPFAESLKGFSGLQGLSQ